MWYPSTTDSISGTAKGYYPKFELGILLGVGLEVPIHKNLDLTFDNNFSMNLLPVADWGSEKTKVFNLNFEVGLAYTFRRDKAKSAEKQH